MYFKVFISNEKKVFPCKLYNDNCWLIKTLSDGTKTLETYRLKSLDKVLLGLDFEDVTIYDGDKIEVKSDNKTTIYNVRYKSGKFLFKPEGTKQIELESFDVFNTRKSYEIKILSNKYEMN